MALRSLAAAATGLGLALTACLTAGGAVASTVDTTPPVWSKLPTTSVELGATLETSYDDCWGTNVSSLPAVVDMRAADPESGIAHYSAWGNDEVDFVSGRYATTVTEFDHGCGGGSKNVEFFAVNGAGLYGEGQWWQPSRLGVIDDSDPAVTTSGKWSTSRCVCWSEGTVLQSTRRGSSVKIAVPATLSNPAGHFVTQTPYSFGLVMAQGPNRGKAAVVVDGVRVATVDTYAPSPVNRKVVWRQQLSAGAHTVEVVNLGTAGRPRIDVDAATVIRKN